MPDLPKDHEGNELKPGDIVAIPAIITGIDRHEEFINIAVLTRWPMYPGDNPTAIILNTKQVLLVKKSEEVDPESVHVMDVVQEIRESDSAMQKGRDENAGGPLQ